MKMLLTLLLASASLEFTLAGTACQSFAEHKKWRTDNDFYQKMYFNVKKEIDGEYVYRIDLLVQDGKNLYVTGPVPPKHYFNNWALVLVMEDLYCPYAEGTGGWGMTGPNQFFSSNLTLDSDGWSIGIFYEEKYLLIVEPMTDKEYLQVYQDALDELKISIKGFFPNATFIPNQPRNSSPYASGEWNFGNYDFFGKSEFSEKGFEIAIRTYYFLSSPHDIQTFKELKNLVSEGKLPEWYINVYMPNSLDSAREVEYKIKSLDSFFRNLYQQMTNRIKE